MNTKTAHATKRMTRKEFFAESDRLLEEARGFLDDARRNREESEAIRERNQRMIQELKKELLCGKK